MRKLSLLILGVALHAATCASASGERSFSKDSAPIRALPAADHENRHNMVRHQIHASGVSEHQVAWDFSTDALHPHKGSLLGAGNTVSVMDVESDGTQTSASKDHCDVIDLQPERLQPVSAGVTRNGSRLFVALRPSNRLAVVPARALEMRDYIQVAQPVGQPDFAPDKNTY